jgi:2-polyprenyl-3-methyl-5-hydroxy-6-metoxy-1,4-benzoquinol methylase
MKVNEIDIDKCPLCFSDMGAKFLGYRTNSTQGVFPARKYKNAAKVYCCNSCGLVYNNPQLMMVSNSFSLDDSLIELTKLDADKIKSSPAYEDVISFLKNSTQLKPGSKVLDVGMGIGRVAYSLKQAGYEAYGLEPKKELYDYAIENKFIKPERAYNLIFEEAEFTEEKFDFIFLEPLNHFNDPHVAIQKTLGWLKPNGYLHLEVSNSRWLYKSILRFIYTITLKKTVPYTSPLKKPFHACEYSKKTFEIYCRLNNLKISYLVSYPCQTNIKIKWLDRLVRYIMVKFYCGMEISVIIRKP